MMNRSLWSKTIFSTNPSSILSCDCLWLWPSLLSWITDAFTLDGLTYRGGSFTKKFLQESLSIELRMSCTVAFSPSLKYLIWFCISCFGLLGIIIEKYCPQSLNFIWATQMSLRTTSLRVTNWDDSRWSSLRTRPLLYFSSIYWKVLMSDDPPI